MMWSLLIRMYSCVCLQIFRSRCEFLVDFFFFFCIVTWVHSDIFWKVYSTGWKSSVWTSMHQTKRCKIQSRNFTGVSRSVWYCVLTDYSTHGSAAVIPSQDGLLLHEYSVVIGGPHPSLNSAFEWSQLRTCKVLWLGLACLGCDCPQT